MRCKEWAEKNGLTVQTVQRWCRDGRMPEGVQVIKNAHTFLIIDPRFEEPQEIVRKEKVVCYARVSTRQQSDDLTRQADRIHAFAINAGYDDVTVVKEIASGMNEKRKQLNAILKNPEITTIIVEHRERLSRINFQLIESALKAQGRRIIVIDNEEIEDDIVRDIIEIMTSFCGKLYGKRAAKHKAQAALEAAKNA